MADLAQLIATFRQTKATWEARFEEDCEAADSSPEWDAFVAAEHAILTYPCRTLEDVRVKATFFLIAGGPFDTLRNGLTPTTEGQEEEETLAPFLRSLLGETPR